MLSTHAAILEGRWHVTSLLKSLEQHRVFPEAYNNTDTFVLHDRC